MSEAQYELAHVLFMDLVGYSQMLIDDQRDVLRDLKGIVRNTAQFRSGEEQKKLVCLPTGDGMVVAFFTAPDAAVRCDMEISRALPDHPQLQLRMGIHSGPVSRIADVNENANIAGGGINTAQRVMDCGDAGHILLSQRVAEDLAQFQLARTLLSSKRILASHQHQSRPFIETASRRSTFEALSNKIVPPDLK